MNYLTKLLLACLALALVACAAPQQTPQEEAITTVEPDADETAGAEESVETGASTDIGNVSGQAASDPETPAQSTASDSITSETGSTTAASSSQPVAESEPDPEPEPAAEIDRPTTPIQLQGVEQLLEQKVFYFDFDQSVVKDDSFDALDAHAIAIGLAIAENPGLIVTVEGHADERGTQEYNIALGMRRAEAVSRYLRVKGIPAANISTISFGEAKPVELGSDEVAWAANRRAVLQY